MLMQRTVLETLFNGVQHSHHKERRTLSDFLLENGADRNSKNNSEDEKLSSMMRVLKLLQRKILIGIGLNDLRSQIV